jgi:hypothetical protein
MTKSEPHVPMAAAIGVSVIDAASRGIACAIHPLLCGSIGAARRYT